MSVSADRAATRWRPDPCLLLILILGCALRSQYLMLPMAEAHRWRELVDADVARNFYERSMNLFYPQVNWGGADNPYVGMEFPLMYWIAALLYFPFGEHAVIGRLVSMAFSLGTIWTVYAIGRRLFGVAAGRAAAFLFAVSPSAVFFGRFLISDTPMVFFSAAAVLGWIAYLDTGSRRTVIAATAATALACLVKIPAVMIFAPIALAAWEVRGWRALKDRALIAGSAGALAITALWYWHADRIYHRTGLGVAIFHPAGTYAPPIATAAGRFTEILSWSTRATLTDRAFYEDMLWRFWSLHFTPVGFALVLFGLLAMWRTPRARIVAAWFGVVVLFILVASEGNRHHEFYQLPILPPAALLFGLAAARAFDGQWLSQVGGRVFGALGSAATLLVIALMSFQNSGVVQAFFRPDRLDRIPIEAGLSLQRVVAPASLLVTVEYDEFGNNSPILLYWAHRRGWTFDKTSISPQVIELLRRDFGARYFVTTIAPVLQATRPDVMDYLRTKRRVSLPDAPRDTVLFDLTEPAN